MNINLKKWKKYLDSQNYSEKTKAGYIDSIISDC